ncbi:spidroin-2 isoform X3 [Harpia harpyja]|uniref:spidroin-2 isoform X3 n=1 Tax=Harpia harpyja TaxID=202280 RepID=UPI0022B161CB|nr:spidroin-2 isoform X3 [Harpia harpyja]XP_052654354.1 spidroin-2 isoform X3 [Harpia harpyja]
MRGPGRGDRAGGRAAAGSCLSLPGGHRGTDTAGLRRRLPRRRVSAPARPAGAATPRTQPAAPRGGPARPGPLGPGRSGPGPAGLGGRERRPAAGAGAPLAVPLALSIEPGRLCRGCPGQGPSAGPQGAGGVGHRRGWERAASSGCPGPALRLCGQLPGREVGGKGAPTTAVTVPRGLPSASDKGLRVYPSRSASWGLGDSRLHPRLPAWSSFERDKEGFISSPSQILQREGSSLPFSPATGKAEAWRATVQVLYGSKY